MPQNALKTCKNNIIIEKKIPKEAACSDSKIHEMYLLDDIIPRFTTVCNIFLLFLFIMISISFRIEDT